MKNYQSKFVLRIVSLVTIVLFAVYPINTFGQNDGQSWLNLDTVKAGKFDTGRMWTFEFPPLDYFEDEYNFRPTDEWLDNVRMAALRFANYCSASFISADGLVMTNHHCGRTSITQVNKEGEDLHTNGFIAATLEEERPVPGLYVDQLVLIKDVTEEVHNAIDKGADDAERAANEKSIITEIQNREKDKSGLKISVVKLFNGGKYSLYGYKTYNDVRLVFAPETQLGFFGGDPDNFTYPRYNMDCTFFRVYDEEGKPLKTEHYFKWSPNGAAPGEAVFVVGNPGSTARLNTVAQLEYQRDYQYPATLNLLNDLVAIYSQLMEESPDKKEELQDQVFSFANSQKAYGGILKGLRDPVLMQKKRDFENQFKEAVFNNEELNEKYGMVWENIESTRGEMREISNEYGAINLNKFTSSGYFFTAQSIVDLAEQLMLPEEERSVAYKDGELETTIETMIPEDFDPHLNHLMLVKQIDRMIGLLGMDHPLVEKMTEGRRGKEAADFMLANSSITSIQGIKSLIDKGPEEVLNSEDPFIYFIVNTKDRKVELQSYVKEIAAREGTYTQLLGRALFEVYGTSIPPDATFTLRISDGVVVGFPYNGTYAPPITTFHGMYDRYYGFGKEFPWSLPERWQNPPAEFDLGTPFNFVSTNDIIGGNSGSPVINKDAQIVGLAFDGNIESLPGNFIFTTEENRTVSVHSAGMFEAIQDLYKNKRLSEELKSGNIYVEPPKVEEKKETKTKTTKKKK
ncbi:MAG: S46 family peptidase [Ignavibacteriales bacterium]|nr:MAG: S46 family peptidase [Ignavibacteriales bacterium]